MTLDLNISGNTYRVRASFPDDNGFGNVKIYAPNELSGDQKKAIFERMNEISATFINTSEVIDFARAEVGVEYSFQITGNKTTIRAALGSLGINIEILEQKEKSVVEFLEKKRNVIKKARQLNENLMRQSFQINERV